LSDTTKDWAANILLYAITETRAVSLKGENNIDKWRKYQKETDMKK